MGGCYTNPTTGRRQLEGLGRDQEMALGAQESPKLVAEMGGEVQNPALRGYIDEVGQSLKQHTEADGPQRQWFFTLIDSDIINAFALPGERVFMSRGLADKMTSEAQLAGVLGHEIGHVMARHTAERIGQAQIGQGILTVGGIFAGNSQGGQIAMQGGQLLIGGTLLKFSREQESEADKLGMRYMTKAGYNPRGQLEVMEILKAASGGGGGTPEILATHPLPQTRIDDIQNMLNSEYAYTQTGPQAANFQSHQQRFQQRYLAVRSQMAPSTPTNTKPAGKDGTRRNLAPRRSELPTDASGRSRTLAAINLDDPSTWCLVCIANAQMQEHAADHHGTK